MNIIIWLSPMAWYTDSAFRQLVREIYPETFLVTELISADWLKYASKNTKELIKHNINEKPLAVQLFGKHPNFFAESAKICESYWAWSIDINMWCPAKKVIHSGHWSSLIKTPELAFKIVEETVKATKLKVSVKTRLWWDRNECWCKYCISLWNNLEELENCSMNAKLIEFCKWLENAWAYQIVIHWRTVKQWYSWLADWNHIYEVKKNLFIPVIWNGDIKTPNEALKKIKNLNWIFVWRATIWDPWLIKRIAQAFKWEKIDNFPQFEERKKWIIRHTELNIETKWEKKWILEMRKHLADCVKWLSNAKDLRTQLVQVNSLKEIKNILEQVIPICI